MSRVIETKTAPAAVGPYSQAIREDDFLFLSGQIALTPDGDDRVDERIEAQTRQCLDNIAAVLESEGLGIESIVKTTIYLTDIEEFGVVNEVYGSYFETNPPARSTIGVAGLPLGAAVEIEAIAIE